MLSFFTATLLATTLTSIVSAAPLVSRAGRKSQIVTYYGQSAGQGLLDNYCNDSNIDIIPIAFVNGFPYQNDNGQYPSANFGDQCGGYATGTKLFDNCWQLKPAIELCQKKGKKILISIGGDPSSGYSLAGDDAGVYFANIMWDVFGPLKSTYTGPRPFGDLMVDGFDFDIEGGGGSGYGAMANQLRSLMDSYNPSMILTAAPQCIVPDGNLADAITKARFDQLYIQFYNTPYCSARAGVNYANNGNTGNDMAFDSWVSWIQSNVPGKNWPSLFIGLPGGPNAVVQQDQYLNAHDAKIILSRFYNHPMFGGVMLWDAGNARSNPDGNFVTAIADILAELNGGSTTTTTTVSSTTSSTTTSPSTTAITTTSSEASTTTAAVSTSLSTTSIASTSTTSPIVTSSSTTTESTTSSATTSAIVTSSATTSAATTSSSTESLVTSTTSETSISSSTVSSISSSTTSSSSTVIETTSSATTSPSSASTTTVTSTTSIPVTTTITTSISGVTTTTGSSTESTSSVSTLTTSSFSFSYTSHSSFSFPTSHGSSFSFDPISTISTYSSRPTFGTTTSDVITTTGFVRPPYGNGTTTSSGTSTSESTSSISTSLYDKTSTSAYGTSTTTSYGPSATTQSGSASTSSSSTSVANHWGQWPIGSTTSSKPSDPTTTNTVQYSWSAWETSSTKPADPTSSFVHGWSAWPGTSSKTRPATSRSTTFSRSRSTTSKPSDPTTSVKPWGPWPTNVYVTTTTTVYTDVCPTGFTKVTGTITATVTVTDPAKPPKNSAWPTGSAGIPAGFYVSSAVCSVGCGNGPVTVVVTVPIPSVITLTVDPTPAANTATWSDWSSSTPVAAPGKGPSSGSDDGAKVPSAGSSDPAKVPSPASGPGSSDPSPAAPSGKVPDAATTKGTDAAGNPIGGYGDSPIKVFTGGAAADQAPATAFSVAVCLVLAIAGLVL